MQFVGESMDPEGMVALLNYREDGVTREGITISHCPLLTCTP
jgi:Translationally controlled tumour protein